MVSGGVTVWCHGISRSLHSLPALIQKSELQLFKYIQMSSNVVILWICYDINQELPIFMPTSMCTNQRISAFDTPQAWPSNFVTNFLIFLQDFTWPVANSWPIPWQRWRLQRCVPDSKMPSDVWKYLESVAEEMHPKYLTENQAKKTLTKQIIAVSLPFNTL